MPEADPKPTLLWVDHDESESYAVAQFARRAGIELQHASTLRQAYDMLTSEMGARVRGIILDAVAPLGGKPGADLLNVDVAAFDDDDRLHIAGQALLHRLGQLHGEPVEARTVVLSFLNKEELVAEGFPGTVAGFYQKSMLDQEDHWEALCQAICDLAGVAGPKTS